MVIRGSGQATRREQGRGEVEAIQVEIEVAPELLLELIALLVELGIWQQAPSDYRPVPDEKHAILRIHSGEQSRQIEAWFNDAAQYRRLLQIKGKMVELTRKN